MRTNEPMRRQTKGREDKRKGAKTNERARRQTKGREDKRKGAKTNERARRQTKGREDKRKNAQTNKRTPGQTKQMRKQTVETGEPSPPSARGWGGATIPPRSRGDWSRKCMTKLVSDFTSRTSGALLLRCGCHRSSYETTGMESVRRFLYRINDTVK
ncbi:hypothetical protein BD769DRAFT_1382450 [Suillus cothurnatus]|nr:hypothetical protein BD769DRAFT_1382450 [Suillus cothurnatus]